MTQTNFGVSTIEDDERRTSRWMVWGTAVSVTAAIVWAAMFDLDETTRGQGRVIPTSREQVIQSLESGLLAELNVREGDAVEKDQVLLRIDDARSGAVFREAREKQLALIALTTRLRSEADSIPLQFPAALAGEKTLVERERRAYQARKLSLEEQLSAYRKALDSNRRELELARPLVSRGVMSEVEVLRLQKQQADIEGQIAERRNRYLTDAQNELVRVSAELAQTNESASGREDVFRRTVVRAPMRGIVKNVAVTTIGGVINAGQPILEIVPTQEEMLIEAYVRPSEVGFLKVGQAATVKLTAYDFNRFGGLDGTLERISPGTLKDEKQHKPGTPVEMEEGYYRLLVRIRAQDRNRRGITIEPLPGMTAAVEIRTGQKSVLQYLIRPLQNVSQALQER